MVLRAMVAEFDDAGARAALADLPLPAPAGRRAGADRRHRRARGARDEHAHRPLPRTAASACSASRPSGSSVPAPADYAGAAAGRARARRGPRAGRQQRVGPVDRQPLRACGRRSAGRIVRGGRRGAHRRLAALRASARAHRRRRARDVRRRLVSRAVGAPARPGRRADDRPDGPLPRAARGEPRSRPATPVLARLPLDAPRPTASSRRTASCGRPTASCSPRAASSRCSSRSTGRGVTARLPRPGLERRRPPRATCRPPSTRCPRHGVRVLASSSTYDTDPVGEVLDQPASSTPASGSRPTLEPEELLDACKAVERELGRDLEGGVRHGPRPIDVDLLLLGDREYRSRAADAAARAGARRGASC